MRIVIEATPEEFAAMLSKLTNPKFEVHIANQPTSDQKEQFSIGTPLDTLDLTHRSQHILEAEGINTIEDLLKCTATQLLRLPNIGRKSLNDIKDALTRKGLGLAN